jgi:hypothetical protein
MSPQGENYADHRRKSTQFPGFGIVTFCPDMYVGNPAAYITYLGSSNRSTGSIETANRLDIKDPSVHRLELGLWPGYAEGRRFTKLEFLVLDWPSEMRKGVNLKYGWDLSRSAALLEDTESGQHKSASPPKAVQRNQFQGPLLSSCQLPS